MSIVHLPSAPPRKKPVTHKVYVYVREVKDTDHGVYEKCAHSHCSCFEASAETIKEKKEGKNIFYVTVTVFWKCTRKAPRATA